MEHLIRTHSYVEPEARRIADAENECLYPQFKAPLGQFSVVTVDAERSRGAVVGDYECFEDAMAVAVKLVNGWPEVFIVDDQGREEEIDPSQWLIGEEPRE